MKDARYCVLIPFLVDLLMVACNPGTANDLSESLGEQHPRQNQQLLNKESLAKQEKVLETTAVQTLRDI